MYIPSTSDLLPSSILTGDSDEETNRKWSSLIGVTTAIIGNVLISFALNTQRYAHMRLQREREEQEEKQRRSPSRHRKTTSYGTQQNDIAEERAEANAKAERMQDSLAHGDDCDENAPLIPRVGASQRRGSTSSGSTALSGDAEVKNKSYLRSPIWWAGIVMMTIGEAGNFLAYGFAPASIVSPLGVVALVSNCLIAPLLLHERFRWRDGLGVIIAVAGCVTVVLSASDSDPRLGPDEIWDLISTWEFETYLGITIFLIIILSVASNKFGERTILIDLGLVGLFGGYTALSTKGVASLLSNTIWRVVTFPITYVLVAVLVFTAVMQIKYVNRALQRFSSTMVIPVQFVMFTLSVIIGSAILYRDFERTTPEDAGEFVGGCALTFLGVWCITSGRSNEEGGDEEMALEDQEDAIDLLDDEGVQPEVRERDDLGSRKQSIISASSAATPTFRRFSVADSIPEAPAERLGDSYFTTENLAPANAAAIHSASTSDLPTEVPPESSSGSLHPPPFHATTSAPIVPTTESPHRPRTPMNRRITHAEGSPASPQRQPTPQHLEPGNAAGPERQRLLTRHSVAGFLPAPFTSPLSNSLSAIVADSLRRGTDGMPASPLRRRSTKLRRKGTGETGVPKRHSIASGEMDVGGEDGGGGSSASRPGTGRMRSFSATLGETLRSVSRKVSKSKIGGREDTIPESAVREG